MTQNLLTVVKVMGLMGIVVVALVEFGGSGSAVAAPIVAKTADFYLRRKYGIAIDTIQTLAEHIEAGVSAPWARWVN